MDRTLPLLQGYVKDVLLEKVGLEQQVCSSKRYYPVLTLYFKYHPTHMSLLAAG